MIKVSVVRCLGTTFFVFRRLKGEVWLELAASRPPNMGRNAVGGRGEPQGGLATSPLSRNTRLKDATYPSSIDHTAWVSPTAEPIFGELPATRVINRQTV
ncbi:hypothetical protein D8911_03040 [Levilactobacillus brevis]|nr:hypothetical protein D8911_03040 [Levilactobacillus brevis]